MRVDMSILDDLLTDKYLLHGILCVYSGLLKEQKALHENNCPECERKERPCKKYYWLCLDIAEIEQRIRKVEKDMKG